MLELPYIGDSWGSSAGIVIRLWVGQFTFELWWGQETVCLQTMQGAARSVLGTISVEVKWPGCGGDLSPPSGAKVKSEWSCTSTSLVSLYGVYSNKCLQHLFKEVVFWVNFRL
jgi:hypothetical protein